ncbi:MAG: hypothetical protein M9928_11105 [Anaerolineae bacterium]|nr:hypothetical protein [Anaerolineae bacterium]MCO5205573.1 hypothetical protein [Anaerolineae bacterium]
MPQQQFHPISMLPMFSEMIDGMLEMTQGQHRMFSSALAKPHVLDDETVDQARDAFEEQLEFVGLYENQVGYWRRQDITPAQRQEMDRLAAQLPLARQLTQEILAMLVEIRKGTIDRIMEKDDFELGLEWLLKMTENEPPENGRN